MSLYGACYERMLFPIANRVRGERTARLFRFLLETERWPAERRQAFREEKLRRLVRHAYDQVPYYRETMDRLGLRPEDIRTVADLAHLPILDRQQIRENPDAFLARDAHTRGLRWTTTSGTTGAQLRSARCANGRMWAWACVYRYFRWMGIRLGDRRLDLWGARDFVPPTTASRRLSLWLRRHEKLSAYETTDAEVDAQVRYVARFRPTLLRGYASALHRFAQHAAALGVRFPSLRAISTSSDALMPSMRRTIEEALGAPAFDQYGCGEVLGVAFECEAHHGLHVAEEHVIAEVDAPPGHEGDLLLTDLDNYAMPLLRYRNGDIATVETGACPCGRPGLRLRSPIGRAGEYIVLPDSRRYNRTFFQVFFNQYPSVRVFQVAQIGEAELEVRIQHDGGEEEILHMERRLHEHLPGVTTVRFRPGIVRPGPTGKLQVIVPIARDALR